MNDHALTSTSATPARPILPPPAARNTAQRILAAFADRPHIFNLGHGILPDVPIAHVHQALKRIGAE